MFSSDQTFRISRYITFVWPQIGVRIVHVWWIQGDAYSIVNYDEDAQGNATIMDYK